MVTAEFIRERAMANRRHTVGRAFCIALGIYDQGSAPSKPRERKEYEGVMWCFRNFGSPMDRM